MKRSKRSIVFWAERFRFSSKTAGSGINCLDLLEMIPILATRVKLRLKLKSFKTFTWMRRNERFGAEMGNPLVWAGCLPEGQEACAGTGGGTVLRGAWSRCLGDEGVQALEGTHCLPTYRCAGDGSVVVAMEAPSCDRRGPLRTRPTTVFLTSS